MEENGRRKTLWTMLALPLGLAAVAAGRGSSAEAKAASGGATLADLQARLDRAEARQEITEVLYDYARADDRLDEELLKSCFWPDSKHKHGTFDGTSTDFIAFSLNIIRQLKYAAHHISNVSVQVKGDNGFSECYYFAHHRRVAKTGGGEEDAFFQGRYIDRHERRNGVWKIIQRRGVSDYSAVVAAAKPFADWPVDQRSGRFPDDPYYTMLREFRDAG